MLCYTWIFKSLSTSPLDSYLVICYQQTQCWIELSRSFVKIYIYGGIIGVLAFCLFVCGGHPSWAVHLMLPVATGVCVSQCGRDVIRSLQTGHNTLAQWGLQKMDDISQTIFSPEVSWMKIILHWFKYQWIVFLMFQLTINQHWFR